MKIRDIFFALLFLSAVIFTSSCSTHPGKEELEVPYTTSSVADTQTYLLRDTTVNLFWKESNKLNNENGAISVNANYLDTMSEPEKAALGYVSLFTLQPNASEKNITFLKQWFRFDKKSLAKIIDYRDSCSDKKEFEEIKLIVNSDIIKVRFKTNATNAGGIMTRIQEDTFRLDRNNLCLIEEKEVNPN